MASQTSMNSYVKALFLFAILVLVFILGNTLLKFSQMPSRPIKALFGQEVLDGMPFTEEQKDSVKQKIAGFWYCENVVDSFVPFLRITDKMELKPNGIFWRVKSVLILLPSGDTSSVMIVTTGYMSPYCYNQAAPESISCQIHFIGQVFATQKDTCYNEFSRIDPSMQILPQLQVKPKPGEGVVDTVWNLIANGRRFEFENTKYLLYDTSGENLFKFFPKNSVELINNLSINKCAREYSLETIVKKELIKDISNTKVNSLTQEDILKIIEIYYKNLFAVNFAKRLTSFRNGTITFSITVNSLGKVIDAQINKAKPLNLKLNKQFKNELLTWIFPKSINQQKEIKVKYSFEY
jgi:hypothetical protein